MNRSIDAALRYHEVTKHSPQSVRAAPHFLDWSNRPRLFKQYVGLETTPLPPAPEALVPLRMAVPEALAGSESPPDASSPPLDLATLAPLLFYAAGVTKTRRDYAGDKVYFRAAACTGALYHIELYLVCGKLDGLPAGVYHFAPLELSLERLRDGDWRPYLARASGAEPIVARAPAMLVWTSNFWRNAWKYRARTYRHSFWDGGTILANLLATANALGQPAHLVLGFADAPVNRLLDIDPEREAALGIVTVGLDGADPERPVTVQEPEVLGLETVAPSRAEIPYAAIGELQRDSSLETGDEARQWRESASGLELSDEAEQGETTLLAQSADAKADGLGEVIRRRGSTRRFSRKPISFDELSFVLEAASAGLSADWRRAFDAHLTDLYVIANEVSGLGAGSYVYHREARSLELLKSGNFREEARFLDLEQPLAGDAAANIYVLARLDPILAALGNRGYRAAQLEGGIAGGRIYLAAYAQRFGATGLTFYDDDVIRFFSPRAEGSSVLFLAAVGRSAKLEVLHQG